MVKCDCGKDLELGSFFTKWNEIEYMECEKCGIVEVNGVDMQEDSKV